jgi:hypothetical protein
MWKHLVTGVPSSFVLLLSVWLRPAPPEAGLTSFTSVGPGGCSSDCSCPTFPVVTCEAERSIAATATASLQWWWSLTLISLVVNLIVIGFLWVSLPYICVGAFESKRSPIISFVGEVKAEQKIDKGGLGAAVFTGKGGPVIPAERAVWRKNSAKP